MSHNLAGNPEGKSPLARQGCKWEDIIIMNDQEKLSSGQISVTRSCRSVKVKLSL
jgi:hypothetical protein